VVEGNTLVEGKKSDKITIRLPLSKTLKGGRGLQNRGSQPINNLYVKCFSGGGEIQQTQKKG